MNKKGSHAVKKDYAVFGLSVFFLFTVLALFWAVYQLFKLGVSLNKLFS